MFKLYTVDVFVKDNGYLVVIVTRLRGMDFEDNGHGFNNWNEFIQWLNPNLDAHIYIKTAPK